MIVTRKVKLGFGETGMIKIMSAEFYQYVGKEVKLDVKVIEVIERTENETVTEVIK